MLPLSNLDINNKDQNKNRSTLNPEEQWERTIIGATGRVRKESGGKKRQ